MLSRRAAEEILGLETPVILEPEEMAARLTVTFFPYSKQASVSAHTKEFFDDLKARLTELGVKIVPYESSLIRIPLHKAIIRFFKILYNNTRYVFEKAFYGKTDEFFITYEVLKKVLRRTKVKSGISVFSLGEQETDLLPIDFVSNFKKSSVITVLDMPPEVSGEVDFKIHFDKAMELFAYHMTNIVLLVGEKKWTLYNFNASHPTYDIETGTRYGLLHGLIPKIYAPIKPLRFSELTHVMPGFNAHDEAHKSFIEDFVHAGAFFEKTGLYPQGKKLDSLPFRTPFYRWVGALHLDHRSGMSYGFLARQLPTRLSEVYSPEQAKKEYSGLQFPSDADYVRHEGHLFVKLQLDNSEYVLKVPEVWMLTLRSGANKTKIDPDKDVLKLGLVHGEVCLQAPQDLVITRDYKPSFDTGVILAHAVSTAIIASIRKHVHKDDVFAKQIEEQGQALVHWHGYLNSTHVPEGWHMYGINNAHVACSSPQSAMYAMLGKLELFETLHIRKAAYMGEVHIEPHHGTNMTYPTLKAVGEFFFNNPDASALGNKYLEGYNTK
jgi:hypothetical protein